MTTTPRPASELPRSAGLDGSLSSALVGTRRFFTKAGISEDQRSMFVEGGREGDVFYRDRWSHDKVVRSTDLVALETVEEGGLFRRFWDSIRLFFYSLFN